MLFIEIARPGGINAELAMAGVEMFGREIETRRGEQARGGHFRRGDRPIEREIVQAEQMWIHAAPGFIDGQIPAGTRGSGRTQLTLVVAALRERRSLGGFRAQPERVAGAVT